MIEQALIAPEADEARQIRTFLTGQGYTREGLTQAFGSAQPPNPHLRNLARLVYRSREASALDTLARLFLLDMPVASGRVRETLPAWLVDLALALGMAVEEDGALAPAMLITPYRGLLIAADPYRRLQSARRFDHVLTLNPAAEYVADMTVRRPAARTLDLGTGCGVQALLAAAHSGEVLATDINPRAVAYAAFNARLNGLDNIACVAGDGFAPAAGKRFDLIVTNPPFIVAPAAEYLYRDSGIELDGFCLGLIESAPACLADGGIFQMAFEWVQLDGEASWWERLERRLPKEGCDAWVVKNYTDDPETYAQTRLRERFFEDAATDRAMFEQWMRFYAAKRVSAIHGGIVVLRRRRGATWVRLDEVGIRGDGPFGEALARAIAAFDFLAAHAEDASLLAERLRLVPEARLDHRARPSETGWQTEGLELRLARGLIRHAPIQLDIALFLARLDGRATLEELVEGLARERGLERSIVEPEVVATVRRLLELGFLAPAG